MSKSLRDIVKATPGQSDNKFIMSKKALEGTNKSTVRPGSTGSDPYVDYMPKSKDEQDFVKIHKTAEFADRNGNTEFPYRGGTKVAKYPRQSKDVYEAKLMKCETCGKSSCSCTTKEAKPGGGEGLIWVERKDFKKF